VTYDASGGESVCLFPPKTNLGAVNLEYFQGDKCFFLT
jgi:hypothetical protein